MILFEWAKRLKWWSVKFISGIGDDILKGCFYFSDDKVKTRFYFGDVVILTHHQMTCVWEPRLSDIIGVPGTSIVTTLERLLFDFGDDIGIKF